MKSYFWKDKDRIINEVLQPLLRLDYSVTKACKYAGIPQRTVQSWIEKDTSLRLKVGVWRNEVSLKARQNVAVAVLGREAPKEWVNEKASLNASLLWLSTREKDDFMLKFNQN